MRKGNYLLAYNVVFSAENEWILSKKRSLPSSGSKNKPSKKPP
jgi:hypothetical protein